jgi:molecular chaperone DnaK
MNTVGIDLGTTNSVCCTVKDGKFEYIKFRNKDLLPSNFMYKDGKITVGEWLKK